jgi:hypothetical protein
MIFSPKKKKMNNYIQINESIDKRVPCTSLEDNTYYNIDLFNHFCEHNDYKYVAIFGYYKPKYRWSDSEAQMMYDKSPDGWTDGLGVYRAYEWGRGDNIVVKNWHDSEWHTPELDHIVSVDEATLLGWPKEKIDHPDNMQVLPRKVNRILTNMTDEQAPALLPIILAQFPNFKS